MNSFLDGMIIVFSFRDMFFSRGIVHPDLKIGFDLIHNGAKLIVTMDVGDTKARGIVLTKDIVKCTPVRLVCLVG